MMKGGNDRKLKISYNHYGYTVFERVGLENGEWDNKFAI